MTEAQAEKKGGEDYFAGRYTNPFKLDMQPKLFRAWVRGYNNAKASFL